MTRYVQLHTLTSYGPSNPNRDDQGRPKQANVGGSPRLRLSSQSIKRAMRESSFFMNDLAGNLGTRTKRLEEKLQSKLRTQGLKDSEKIANAASKVAAIFGQLEDDNDRREESGKKAKTLAFISPEEWRLAEELALKIVNGEEVPADKELKKMVLRTADGAVDIAMFGRMLAEDQGFSRDAAVQVSHAITTHAAIAEDDWFSAVDELNKKDDSGAGHLAETGFGSGVYYLYICVNVDLLIENLDGDAELAAQGLSALVRAAALATPGGKQNSFANRPRAFFIRAELGEQQPRDLTSAFFNPITHQPWEDTSVEALEKAADEIDRAYGQAYSSYQILNVRKNEGTIDEIAGFVMSAAKALAP